MLVSVGFVCSRCGTRQHAVFSEVCHELTVTAACLVAHQTRSGHASSTNGYIHERKKATLARPILSNMQTMKTFSRLCKWLAEHHRP